MPSAATTISSGVRRPCAAISPARCVSTCFAKACIRAWRAVSLRRACASSRQVLDRVEDSATGRIKLDALYAEIPEDRVQQAQAAAKALGTGVYRKLPMVEGMQPMDKDPAELLLNSTWRPTLVHHRRRWHSQPAKRGQRVAAVYGVQAVVPHSAGRRSGTRRALRSKKHWRRIRPTVRRYVTRPIPAPKAGTRPPLRRGSQHPCRQRRRISSARMRCTWASAARFPSWAC